MKNIHDPVFANLDNQLALIRRNINVHSYGVIKSIMGNRIVDSLPLRLRCECSVPNCEDIIEITLAERRELRRAYPMGFIVVHSHGNASGDSTTLANDNYLVVNKRGFSQTVTDL